MKGELGHGQSADRAQGMTQLVTILSWVYVMMSSRPRIQLHPSICPISMDDRYKRKPRLAIPPTKSHLSFLTFQIDSYQQFILTIFIPAQAQSTSKWLPGRPLPWARCPFHHRHQNHPPPRFPTRTWPSCHRYFQACKKKRHKIFQTNHSTDKNYVK